MEKEPLLSRFEYDGSYNEEKAAKKTEQKQPNVIPINSASGSILFSKKAGKKKKAFKWSRIRSFFIMHKKFKRFVEFSIHPTGIHMLRLAVFYSESGCKMCKVYVEKNLF